MFLPLHTEMTSVHHHAQSFLVCAGDQMRLLTILRGLWEDCHLVADLRLLIQAPMTGGGS